MENSFSAKLWVQAQRRPKSAQERSSIENGKANQVDHLYRLTFHTKCLSCTVRKLREEKVNADLDLVGKDGILQIDGLAKHQKIREPRKWMVDQIRQNPVIDANAHPAHL